MRDRNLSSKLTPWIEKGIDQAGQGENILWTLTVIPAPDGSIPVVLGFWLPGAVLGTCISGAVMVANPLLLDEDSAVKVVADVLEQLRTQRSSQLAENSTPAVSPLLNGASR